MINDAWVRKKKKINRERKAQDLPPLPDNKWTQALGVFITFNVVMLSFLLFSGFLDQFVVSKNSWEINRFRFKRSLSHGY